MSRNAILFRDRLGIIEAVYKYAVQFVRQHVCALCSCAIVVLAMRRPDCASQ
jgi:hypothetical protein